jgi:hypothetical protein
MTYVHLANVPRHVCWLKHDLDALICAMPMNFIHVIYPDRHPNALVLGFAALFAKGRGISTSPATSLSIEAKEDLALARAHSTKRRRIAPIPALLPPEFLEPIKALLDIGNIQYRGQSLWMHHFASPKPSLLARSEYARRFPEPPNACRSIQLLDAIAHHPQQVLLEILSCSEPRIEFNGFLSMNQGIFVSSFCPKDQTQI